MSSDLTKMILITPDFFEKLKAKHESGIEKDLDATLKKKFDHPSRKWMEYRKVNDKYLKKKKKEREPIKIPIKVEKKQKIKIIKKAQKRSLTPLSPIVNIPSTPVQTFHRPILSSTPVTTTPFKFDSTPIQAEKRIKGDESSRSGYMAQRKRRKPFKWIEYGKT